MYAYVNKYIEQYVQYTILNFWHYKSKCLQLLHVRSDEYYNEQWNLYYNEDFRFDRRSLLMWILFLSDRIL